MRKSRQETAQTRVRIVQAAAAEFRRRGIDGTGLADLMAAAGMTRGGFYKHFASKEQVVEESLVLGIQSMVDAMQETLSAAPGATGLNTAIAEYLAIDHRDDAIDGCPFAALASDMARSSETVRDAATAGFLQMVGTLASQLDRDSPEAAQDEAMWMMCTMIGTLTMARVVTDPALSARLLAQAQQRLARPS